MNASIHEGKEKRKCSSTERQKIREVKRVREKRSFKS